LGYGPFSSIAYSKPPFEGVSGQEVQAFFENKVPGWIDARTSKWGDGIFADDEPEEDDYVLVLAQNFKDETVDGMWFGNYWTALCSVVNALVQIGSRVVVKLHPWTDGTNGFDHNGKPKPPTKTEASDKAKAALEQLGTSVSVYSGPSSVHGFLRKARCVVLCNSGSGLEAMLHKKPIISWGFPEYHWATYDLRHLCDLPRALTLDWFDADEVAKFICWYAEHYCIYDYNSAVRRVGELLGEPPL